MDKDKVVSSILGFIIGDSLGVPFEFESREKLKMNPVTTMVGGGSWDQPIGTWSDDSSMVLSTIESLSGGYDLNDLGHCFDNWLFKNHFTPHGEVFDCGIQTRESLKRIHNQIIKNQTITPLPPSSDEKQNGNGSLMRILPLGFYLQNHSIEERWEIIYDVSSLTHSHIRSIIGCFIYTELVIDLINGFGKLDSYQRMKERVSGFLTDKVPSHELDLYGRILGSDISTLKESEIRSTPYVVYTLESVLWCFLGQENFKDSVLTGVNLGGDTDTIGGLVGGLSGIVYNDIPKKWIDVLVRKDEILELINKFVGSV